MYIRSVDKEYLIDTKNVRSYDYRPAVYTEYDGHIIGMLEGHFVYATTSNKDILLATMETKEECLYLINVIESFICNATNESTILDLSQIQCPHEKTDVKIVGSEELKIQEITLLSAEEYRTLKDNIKPIDSWWWLRTAGIDGNAVSSVQCNGELNICSTDVLKHDGSVRPVLRIENLNALNLTIGSSFKFGITVNNVFKLGRYTWTIISEELALCDEAVGQSAFKKDGDAKNSNQYESSDIKKWLNEWAEEQQIKRSCNKRTNVANKMQQRLQHCQTLEQVLKIENYAVEEIKDIKDPDIITEALAEVKELSLEAQKKALILGLPEEKQENASIEDLKEHYTDIMSDEWFSLYSIIYPETYVLLM